MSEPKRMNVPRQGAGGRGVHDVGGLEFGAIDRTEHDLALWEKRTDAMLILLRDNKRRVLSVDAHRRMIETYGEQEYDRTTYYEKWIRSVRNLLVEQDVLTARRSRPGWPRCGPSTRRPAARRPRKRCRGEEALASASQQGPGRLCPGRSRARRQAPGGGSLPHALVSARQVGGGGGRAGPLPQPRAARLSQAGTADPCALQGALQAG